MEAPLSILCITKAESYAFNFLNKMTDLACSLRAEFVIAADGGGAYTRCYNEALGEHKLCMVQCTGPSLEEALDEAISHCSREYVLRLDSDETFHGAQWLVDRKYLTHDNWAFTTYNLWQDRNHYITNAPLWPDIHTRLAIKEKSGGRTQLHAGSPWGMGELAPEPIGIKHHKFLVRNYQQRLATAERYEAFSPGFGLGFMRVYSLPEDVIGVENMVLGEVPHEI